jgi:hypothetical protein
VLPGDLALQEITLAFEEAAGFVGAEWSVYHLKVRSEPPDCRQVVNRMHRVLNRARKTLLQTQIGTPASQTDVVLQELRNNLTVSGNTQNTTGVFYNTQRPRLTPIRRLSLWDRIRCHDETVQEPMIVSSSVPKMG